MLRVYLHPLINLSLILSLFLLGGSVRAASPSPTENEMTSDRSSASSFIRVPRAFFEKPLHAQLKLSSKNGAATTYSSPVAWIEYPPAAPAPQPSDPELGQVLADFRDFVACAEMTELGKTRLCFKVMADVSNLGVNDNEMTLRGVETLGGGAPSHYQLKKASMTANSLDLEFRRAGGSENSVQLTLTQVP